MDFEKENWQTKRKPRFAVDVFRSGATPFRASNRLNVDSELAKGIQTSQSQATTEKEYEKQCSSYASNIFNNYSTSAVSDRKNMDNLYLRGSKFHPKTTSSGSSELKSSSQETPAAHFYSSNVECGSSIKHNSTAHRTTMFRKPVDMDKLRLIRTRDLARRQAATIKAEESIPPKSGATPLTYTLRKSMRKDVQFSSQKIFGERFNKFNNPKETHSHIKVTSKDVQESAGSSQECCRALCFDNIQEVQEDDDVTVPLDLMDMTTIISEASVLQDPMMQQRQEQPQSRPKMNHSNGSFGYRKASNEEDFKICSKDVENDFLNAESKLLSNENLVKGISSRIPPPKVRTKDPIPLKENVNKNQSNKTRLQKRRSAIPSIKHTPKYKSKDFTFRSVSKLNKFSESRYFLRNQTKKVVKVEPHSTVRNSSKKSKIADIPKVVVYPPEPEKVEDETKAPEMCEASTNTDFKCSCGKPPDLDLLKEIVGLIEEQKEIIKKADLVREQTIARRQRMKESHALESFMTSVSPLQRLRDLVQAKKESSVTNDDRPSCKVSVKVTDDHTRLKDDSVHFEDCDMETSDLENTTGNASYMECTILNNTSDLNASHLRWKHLKLDSRIFQTPSSRPNKARSEANTSNEQFDGHIEDDMSPFTEMVGDCERPSLAPMTPHSHHQVSMLKLSLRKQLDQLYEL